jgi:hypothetical protein
MCVCVCVYQTLNAYADFIRENAILLSAENFLLMRALTLQRDRKQNCCLESLVGNSAAKK